MNTNVLGLPLPLIEVEELEVEHIELGTTDEGHIRLPNGCTLYWKTNAVGGRTYTSDEVGGGVHVWDTALVDSATLLAALTQEATLQALERVPRERAAQENRS